MHSHDSDGTDFFGFWLYIMTDCILFGSLFAAFLVLNDPGAGACVMKKPVNLNDVLLETFLLLASNFTYCMAALNLYKNKIPKVQTWLVITFLLGAGFVMLEMQEFIHFASEGYRWDANAQASSFFALVGTHGLHVSFGLLWILVLIVQLRTIKVSSVAIRRMTYLGLFWNFLDIVWIFVFTIAYLMEAIQ